MSESLKLRTSVRTSLKNHVLFQGTVLSGIGAILLLIGGTVLPVGVLEVWGLFLMLAATGLIALGMVPYRRLTLLERSPNEMIIFPDKGLTYLLKGESILTIPLSSIQRFSYVEKEHEYGIGIHLKESLPEKVIIHNPKFAALAFQKNSHDQYGCDLFFPYFTEHSYRSLMEYVSDVE